MRFKEKPVKAGLGLAWAGSYKTDSILYRRIECLSKIYPCITLILY